MPMCLGKRGFSNCGVGRAGGAGRTPGFEEESIGPGAYHARVTTPESSGVFADPFSVFGLPVAFDVDQAALRRAWLRETSRLHPDRPDAPPDAADRLAAINRAKSELERPESRARAVLRAMGEPDPSGKDALPPGFLMEMLEVRESMEAAKATGDAARLAEFESWAREQRGAYEGAFRERLVAAASPPTETDRRDLRGLLNCWRYIERMIEQMDPAYDPRRADFA